MIGFVRSFVAAPLLDLRLAGWPLNVSTMPWWGYVVIAALVLGVAAWALPRVGGRGR